MNPFTQGRYAIVTSTLSLVVALGGTSYAVTQITGHDIKNGTVTSKDIKNHNLALKDLSSRARSRLHGARGVTGATGPQGVAGPTGQPGPSNAYSSYSDGTTPLSSTPKTVLQLVLTPGSYVAFAKTYAYRSSGSSQTSAQCTLQVGGVASDTTLAVIPGGSAVGQEPLFNTITFSLSSPAFITYSCTGSSDGGVQQDKLTAIKVGAATNSAYLSGAG